jgi:serine/threonine protein phosphatase 1
MKTVVRYERNTAGKDLVVGDIHGSFSRLQAVLDAAGFNPEVDRLFSVGDLVDRGPECEQVLEWLDKPWFHAVRGNHDDYVVRYQTCDRDNWMENGGAWFQGLPSDMQAELCAQMAELPIAIEVMTAHGMVGIVHAECPFSDWEVLTAALAADLPHKQKRAIVGACLWSRERITKMDESRVAGVLAVVVGHTVVVTPAALGNTIYIDTGGCREAGRFTLLELDSVRGKAEVQS